MTEKTVVKVAMSAGINKTNMDYVDHHLRQAVVSLDRAMGRLSLVTKDKGGRLATTLLESGKHSDLAIINISDALEDVSGVTTELGELYG